MFEKMISKISRTSNDPKIGCCPVAGKELEKVEELFDWKTLSSFLPYQSYDVSNKIFINRHSSGFVVECLPLLGADEALQMEMTSIVQEIMEEGSSFQILLLADHRISHFLNQWKQSHSVKGSIYKEMALKRAEFFRKMIVNEHEQSPRIFRCILSYSIPSEGFPSDDQIAVLLEKRNQIIKTLSSYTHSFTWEESHLLAGLDGIINYQKDADMIPRSYNPYETLSSQLPTGGLLRITENGLEWDQTSSVFKSYRVTNFPDHWSLNSMQKLIGDFYKNNIYLKDPFFIHYGVHCLPQIKSENALKRRMHLIEQQGKSSLLMRMVPSLKEELTELDFMRKRLQEMDRIVWTQLGVGMWSDKKDLEKSDQAIKTIFRSNQFMLTENKYIHFPEYLSFLPMSWSEYVHDLKHLDVLKTTCSLETGNLMPLQGEWLGTKTPGILLMGRRGQVFYWHPFDNKSGNYNVIVTGRSGSGKSVFMQDLLMSSLGLEAQVFVLDVGRSFEKMCSILEGQFIEFTQSTELCLNPFTFISLDNEEERYASFSMLKSIIATMAAPNQGTTDYENALIEKAIKVSWDNKHNEATITSVAEYLLAQPDERSITLGTMLMPYTKDGIYARYFEGRNNVSFQKNMVLIELEELKDKKDLQIVVLQLFIMTITTRIFLGDRKTPFHICIDEAWDLLRGPQTGIFIETLARRLRKYNGSLIIGTQSIDDFYASKGALAAFENSDWMCLLAQKKSSITRFRDSGKINIDDEQEKALESIHSKHGEYSEVMICDSSSFYAVGRLYLDEFSLLLYSTQAQDYSQLKDLQKKGLSITESINTLLKSRKIARKE